MTNRRNTIQKDLVKNAVYEMKRHVTANEVCEFLKKNILPLEKEQYIEILIYCQKKVL